MGDYNWRTAELRRNRAGWTKLEDAATAGGHFDERPAYIVKLADQQEGVRITSPFHAFRTRGLLAGILHGRLRCSKDLLRWLRDK